MRRPLGERLADKIANFVGSWTFIVLQTLLLVVWVIVNVYGFDKFDPYPFILMNLFLSSEAAYATPMILMSSNRQADRDRAQAQKDLEIDTETNQIIKMLAEDLKLDRAAQEEHRITRQEHQDMKNSINLLHEKIDQLTLVSSGRKHK